MSLPKEYSFWNMAKNYGIKNIIVNWDSIPAIIFTVIIAYYYLPLKEFSDITPPIILTLIGANAGLLAIVIAGFSIITAFVDKKFLEIIKKSGLYVEVVFMFTYTSMLLSIGLISSIFCSLTLPININLSKALFIVAIFTTIYGLFGIILLLIMVKNMAVAKGRYAEQIKDE